jgi:hypothetical protein
MANNFKLSLGPAKATNKYGKAELKPGTSLTPTLDRSESIWAQERALWCQVHTRLGESQSWLGRDKKKSKS